MTKEKKKSPFISIIISAYNEEKNLNRCIKSILKLEYPNYEVVFVDDASTDNTLKILKEYGKKYRKIRAVTYPVNKGVPGARNEGMKAAKGDIFVFTDADAEFFPWWPGRLIAPLFNNPTLGVTGGRDKTPVNEPTMQKCIDYTITSFIGTAGLRGGKIQLSKYAVTGCNFAVKREVVDKVGMHDEKIRWRGEEKEWSQRIREGGYDIKYIPDSYILHYRRVSLKSFWRQTYKSGKARFDILKASPKSFSIVHFAPSLYIISLLISGILAPVFKLSTAIFFFLIISYLLVLIIQMLLGLIRIKKLEALFWVPVTTVMMHFAYGLGFIKKFFL